MVIGNDGILLVLARWILGSKRTSALSRSATAARRCLRRRERADGGGVRVCVRQGDGVCVSACDGGVVQACVCPTPARGIGGLYNIGTGSQRFDPRPRKRFKQTSLSLGYVNYFISNHRPAWIRSKQTHQLYISKLISQDDLHRHLHVGRLPENPN